MVKLTKATTCVLLGSWFVVFMVYDNFANKLRSPEETPRLVKRNLAISNSTNANTSVFDDLYLINTEGCKIPNFSRKLIFKEPKNEHKTCGDRAIFIEYSEANRIKFKIDNEIMKKYSKKIANYTCCYSFASRSNVTGEQDVAIKYSPCYPLQNGTEAEIIEEAITVTCKKSHGNKSTIIYSDAYMVIRKRSKYENINKSHWNVLIIGMDTMSRARALSTLPNAMRYFNENHWLDFKAYQKVGSNTFPNLMALLTGKNVSTVYRDCAGGMDNCNQNIIWSQYKNASYRTAYGEDYLTLPDTFANYKGFIVPPTDHYTRPLFLTGEYTTGNLVCASKKPSAHHLLDYAYDFANAYKDENFFGMFWINSYSHNLVNKPSLLDKEIVKIMEKLNKSGILDNTFVIFNSDHGIRFGEIRQTVESYYSERLPMLFMSVPKKFRKMYANTAELGNLLTNQMRLITPYDVHITLHEILKLSGKIKDSVKSQGCPDCTNLFHEIKPSRTCSDASVDQKWCSCHNLIEISTKDPSANSSIEVAVANIRKKAVSAEAIDCFVCQDLEVKKVLRVHYYKESELDSSTYYVVAVVMSPGDVAFEATVKEDRGEFTVVEPTDTISPYNVRGSCVKNKNLRAFCVCKKIKCRKTG